MFSMLTILVTIFFAAMGLAALAAPERISASYGTPTLTVAGRNEIRAVYGGFGLAIAGVLLVATFEPALARGIYLSVGAALAGMAAGRVVSALIERPTRFYPSWFFFGVETLMAVIVFVAARRA